MTQFVGAALPVTRLEYNDFRLVSLGDQPERENAVLTPNGVFSYATPFWPGSRFIGDCSADVGVFDVANEHWYWDTTSGQNSRLGYKGITRDQYNSPLLGATVKLFRTSDDTKVTPDIVSDTGDGSYVISTPYYEAHWLKVEKAGSPNVQGVSVNNIFPNV